MSLDDTHCLVQFKISRNCKIFHAKKKKIAIPRYHFFMEVNMTSKQKEIAKLIFSIVLNGTIIGLIVFLLIQFT